MIPVVAMAGDAVGTATAASLVTTVTDMAGTMLTTMADNPLLGVFIAVPIAGSVIVLVGKLMRRHLSFFPIARRPALPFTSGQGGTLLLYVEVVCRE